ncbi:hypothetical protein [uncultured Gammaproteobacteria bacterium]|nr:hypothetical protein [uncultured Gammaproteobacteria bacterium]
MAKSSDKLKQRINDNFQAFSLNNKEIKEQAEKALKNGDEFIGIGGANRRGVGGASNYSY